MTVPNFHDWLVAVTPRFPEFQEIAAFVENATGWPDGHDEATLTTFLKRSGAPHLVTSLSRALSSFDLLCTPSAPMPDGMRLPWDWHDSALVEQTRASMKRHSRHENVSPSEYRWQLGRRLAKIISKKTRILVDICHWIKMRDSERSKPVAKEYGQILAQLRRLVASQRYICPITPALFQTLTGKFGQRLAFSWVSCGLSQRRRTGLPPNKFGGFRNATSIRCGLRLSLKL